LMEESDLFRPIKSMALISRVVAMLRDRGFEETKIMGVGKNIVLGTKQASTKHPRQKASAMAYVDTDTSFVSAEVYRIMKGFYPQAINEKLDPSSSLIYVYSFPPLRQRLNTVDDAYLTAVGKGEPYYFEKIDASLFVVDRSDIRSVKDMAIMTPDNFIWVIGNSGKSIVVDRPPSLSIKDPMIQYLGGRKGDYVKYRRLERESVGPIWMATMAIITEPVVTNIPVGAVKEGEEGAKMKKEKETEMESDYVELH